MHTLVDGGFIPVIAPIGVGKQGESYNINADLVAGKVAEILKAEKLVAAHQHARRARQERQAAHRAHAEASRRARSPTARSHGGMLPKIASALDAVKTGSTACHIIDGRVEHALLLEILTDEGVGTLIRSR